MSKQTKSLDELKNTHKLVNLNSLTNNVKGAAELWCSIEFSNTLHDSLKLSDYLESRVNIKPTLLDFENCYKRCSITDTYYSLNNFKLERQNIKRKTGTILTYIFRSSSWKHDYHNVSEPLQKEKNRQYLKQIKDINMRFIRMWMYGAEEHGLYCLLSKKPIKSQINNPFRNINEKLIEVGNFYLHHFLVKNGVSILKEQSPSKYILNPSMLTDQKAIRDLLGTILVSDESHKKIHSMFYDSDISYYKTKYLPYGLRSKSNYNQVKKQFSILESISYDELKSSLYLDKNKGKLKC